MSRRRPALKQCAPCSRALTPNTSLPLPQTPARAAPPDIRTLAAPEPMDMAHDDDVAAFAAAVLPPPGMLRKKRRATSLHSCCRSASEANQMMGTMVKGDNGVLLLDGDAIAGRAALRASAPTQHWLRHGMVTLQKKRRLDDAIQKNSAITSLC